MKHLVLTQPELSPLDQKEAQNPDVASFKQLHSTYFLSWYLFRRNKMENLNAISFKRLIPAPREYRLC